LCTIIQWTALHMAAHYNNNVEVVESLVKSGADVKSELQHQIFEQILMLLNYDMVDLCCSIVCKPTITAIS